jgi:hypothetical protein
MPCEPIEGLGHYSLVEFWESKVNNLWRQCVNFNTRNWVHVKPIWGKYDSQRNSEVSI